MRTLPWLATGLVLMALFAPAAVALELPQDGIQDYAQRDADAIGLADFEGGHAGVVLAIVLIAAVVVLVALILPW